MPSVLRRTVVVGTVSTTLALVVAPMASPGLPAALAVGGSGSHSIAYTGTAVAYTLPAGVYTPVVVLMGAGGGSGHDALGDVAGPAGGAVAADLDTSFGPTVQVVVGGAGGPGTDSTGGAGGFNGGGAGSFDPGFGVGGGGGGGATDVSTGSCATNLSCGPDARVLVAGGGGGTAGGAGYEGPGGAGGGLVGDTGGGEDDGTTGGGGGTDTQPGVGGVDGSADTVFGADGTGAAGGAAAGNGGGGGGGFFGGGGGAESGAANGSGGGGGSGFAAETETLNNLINGAGSTGDGAATFYWMTSSAAMVTPGTSVTLTAHWPQFAGGGTVTFADESSALCSDVAVNGSGTASCTTSSVPAGNHAIQATYSKSLSGAALLDGLEESMTLFVDGTAPEAPTVTTSRKAVQLAAKVKLCYHDDDIGTGVASYDVRYRVTPWNGTPSKPHYPSSWQRTPSTCEHLTGSPGHEYCFTVRGRDRVGHVGAWSKPWCRTLPLDDRAMAVASGHWNRSTGTAYYRHTLSATRHAGATLELNGARVHRIALVVTRCPVCGRLTVKVNSLTFVTGTHAGRRADQQIIVLSSIKLRTATVQVRDRTDQPVSIDGIAIIPS